MDEDRELFNEAVSDTPTAEPPAPTPEPQEEPTRPRDEHGRFAPKAEPEPVAPQPEPEPQPQTQEQRDAIPPWRLREEAEARRAAEARVAEYERMVRELQAQRKPEEKPPPDIFEN